MDPSAGPTVAAAVDSLSGLSTALWQRVAESNLADYLAIFTTILYLRHRRNDPPAAEDSELSTAKNSLSMIVIFAEFCRYFLPAKHVWNGKDAVPADPLVVDAASKTIPTIMPLIAAFAHLILFGCEPLHNSMPSWLPTLSITTTVVFRLARYIVLEHTLRSYYTDLSLLILSLQLALFAVQLFWKVFICTPTSTPTAPQLPVWRKIAPQWLSTMLMLPHLEFETLENLDELYAPPMAHGSQPLFREITAVCESSSPVLGNHMQHFGFSTLRLQFFYMIPPRLILILFTYAMPYVVQDTVILAGQTPTKSDICKSLALTAFVFGGQTFSAAWNQQCRVRFSTQLRTTIINAFSEKLLVISQKHSKKFNLTKLFGKDIDNIDLVIRAFHDFWSSLLELALGIYLVTSISSGSLLAAVFAPIILSLSEPTVEALANISDGWKDAAQKRIAMAKKYLEQYKELKFTGYVLSFNLPLLGLRRGEIEAASRGSLSRSMHVGFYATCRAAAPVIIVATALSKSSQSNPWTVPEYFAIASVTPLMAHSWKTLVGSFRSYVGGGMDGLSTAQDFMAQPDFEPTDRGNPAQQAGSAKKRTLQLRETAFTSPDATSFRYRDLRFEVGKVTMVIGAQGCGKSSLLKALIGEIRLDSGKVIGPTGPIAYSAESAFIQNMSIKDNIVFESPFDHVWYMHVMHACTLHTEMERLSDGDETMAGDGGSKISDFRHLVSLARAVYAKHPVMILDETFDYFEPQTANLILTRLFGKGGILRNKCTVVFSSRTSRDSAHADAILAFNEMRGIEDINSSLSNLPPGLKYDPAAFDFGPMHVSTRQSVELREKEFPRKDNSPEAIRADIASARGSVLTLIAHIDALGVLGTPVLVTVMVVAVVAAKWPMAYIQLQLESGDLNDEYFIFKWVGYTILPLFVIPICSAVYLMTSAANASFIWHINLMKKLETTTTHYTTKYGLGKLIKLHEQDLTLIPTSLTTAFFAGAFMSFAMVAEFYFVFCPVGPFALALAPLGFVLVSGIGMNYAGNDAQVRLIDFDAKLALFNNMADLGCGVEHIRAFGWQRQFLRRTYALLGTSQRAYYYSLLMAPSMGLTIDLIVLVTALLVTAMPLYLTTYTQASIGISLTTVVGLGIFCREAVDSWMRFIVASAPAYHIGRFIVNGPKQTGLPLDPADKFYNWPVDGAIQFERVTAYHDYTVSNEPPILDNINVTMEAGKTVGIIGDIASGKTAFLSAILGTVDYTGNIYMDNIDIRQFDQGFVQQRIVSVSPYLLEFPGTLRDNLDPLHGTRFGNRLSDDVIIDVLKKLTLWREVVGRGASLDSSMEVMGLSRGQREVLNIARGILRQKHLGAKVIIIDGVLDNADDTLDLLVNRVMAEEFRGCTLIKVTHHLATLDDASLVIKMKRGRIERLFQPTTETGVGNQL